MGINGGLETLFLTHATTSKKKRFPPQVKVCFFFLTVSSLVDPIEQ